MEEQSLTSLNKAVNQVVDTLRFYGVEISGIDLGSEGSPPTFRIKVSKKRSKRELKDTLNIAYWLLTTLYYGQQEHYSDTTQTVILKYKEVR